MLQPRAARNWAGVRQFRRQKTISQENEQEGRSAFTIKNLLYHVKLKTRMRQIVHDLSSRRWKLLKRQHFRQINDKVFYQTDEARRRLGYNNKDTENDSQNDEEESDDEEFNEIALANRFQRQSTRSMRGLIASKDICSFLKKILEIIPIFNPNSISKLLWDSFQSILCLFLSVVVPLKLAIQDFTLSYYLGSSSVLSLIIVLICSDILINLNTAFFKRGKIVVKRYMIFKNYMSQIGLLDSLITQSLVWELWGEQQTWWEYSESMLLCLLLYIKALKLHKLMFKIEETFSFNRRTLNMLSLAKLLLFILKVSHAFACIWVFIGRQMIQNGNSSWIEDYKNDGWSSQYLQSYYFISVTMTTIGYGDIVPKNAIETVVCIFSMLLACVIFGYTINIIGSIFMELKKEDEAKKENLLIINRYMNEKKISRDLQSSIREYLEYLWKQQSNDNSDKEQHILEQLSEEMREALLIQANRIVLEDCKFFKKHFSRDVIKKCVHLIKEKKYTPNEPIINSYDDQAKSGVIFFVESGEVDIYQEFHFDQISQDSTLNSAPEGEEFHGSVVPQFNINGQPIQAPPIPVAILQLLTGQQPTQQKQIKQKKVHIKRVKTLKKGDFFGELSFFTNFSNQFIAKSHNFSKILYIERNKFLDYLQSNHFSEDFETFCYLKDCLSQNQIEPLFSKCYICSSYNHTALNCSMVHYYPVRTSAISKYNFSQTITVRTKCRRRKVVMKNSLKDLYKMENIADRYLIKNERFIKEHYKSYEISEDMSESSCNDSAVSEDNDNDLKIPQQAIIKRSSFFQKFDSNPGDDSNHDQKLNDEENNHHHNNHHNNNNNNQNMYENYDGKKILEDEDEILTSMNGDIVNTQAKKLEDISLSAKNLPQGNDNSPKLKDQNDKKSQILQSGNMIPTSQQLKRRNFPKIFLSVNVDNEFLNVENPDNIQLNEKAEQKLLYSPNHEVGLEGTKPNYYPENNNQSIAEANQESRDLPIRKPSAISQALALQEYFITQEDYNMKNCNLPEENTTNEREKKAYSDLQIKIAALQQPPKATAFSMKKIDSPESELFSPSRKCKDKSSRKPQNNQDQNLSPSSFLKRSNQSQNRILIKVEDQEQFHHSRQHSRQHSQSKPKISTQFSNAETERSRFRQQERQSPNDFNNVDGKQILFNMNFNSAADSNNNGRLKVNESLSHMSPLQLQQHLDMSLTMKRIKNGGQSPPNSLLLNQQGDKQSNKSKKDSISQLSLFRPSFLMAQNPNNNQMTLIQKSNINGISQIFQDGAPLMQQKHNSPDVINRKQRMQAVIARTIEKIMEEESLSSMIPQNGGGSPNLGVTMNAVGVKEEKNQNIMYLKKDPLQQLFQNWDAKFESAFESMKIFKNYFPQYNHDKIIQKIKKKRIESVNSKLLYRWQRSSQKKMTSKPGAQLLQPLSSPTIIEPVGSFCKISTKRQYKASTKKKLLGQNSKLSNKVENSMANTSASKEPVGSYCLISNKKEYSISDQLQKATTTSQIETDQDLAMSPSHGVQTTQTNLISVNKKKNQFLPIKSTMTSPVGANNYKLQQNKQTTQEDIEFSDDEFQAFEKLPINTNMSNNEVFLTKANIKNLP